MNKFTMNLTIFILTVMAVLVLPLAGAPVQAAPEAAYLPFAADSAPGQEIEATAGAVIQGNVLTCGGQSLSDVFLVMDGVTRLSGSADGSYRFEGVTNGQHSIEIFKAGYSSQIRTLNVDAADHTYTLDFKGDHSLVPLAPESGLVQNALGKWQYPPADGTQISISKLLSIINAFKHPTDLPQIMEFAPPRGMEIAIDSVISIHFSQKMRSDTINDKNLTLKKGDQPVNGTVTYDAASRTAVFTPSDSLDHNTAYSVNASRTMTSAVGSPLESDFTWNFTTTSDNTRPTVTYCFPADQADGVTLMTYLEVRFSEYIDPLSINNSSTFTLTDGSQSIPGKADYVTDSGIGKMNFDPDHNLDYGTTYTATISRTVKDLNGNHLAADYSWSFTTLPESDTSIINVQSTEQPISGGTLDVTIAVNTVNNLVAGSLTISFDTSVLQIIDSTSGSQEVTNGLISNTPILVSWTNGEDAVRTAFHLENYQGVTGNNGYLMVIHFNVIGAPGSVSVIRLSEAKLFDKDQNGLTVKTQDGSVTVAAP